MCATGRRLRELRCVRLRARCSEARNAPGCGENRGSSFCTGSLNAGREGDKKRKLYKTLDKVYFENLENKRTALLGRGGNPFREPLSDAFIW